MILNINGETPEQQEEGRADQAKAITVCLSANEVELIQSLCDLFWDTQGEVATMQERGEVEALRDKATGLNRPILGSETLAGEEYLEYVFSESQADFIGSVLHEWTVDFKKDNLSDKENKVVNEVLLALFG